MTDAIPSTREAIRDEGVDRMNNGPAGDDIVSHHRDSIWVGMGIHLPATDAARKHHHRRRRHRRNKESKPPEAPGAAAAAPTVQQAGTDVDRKMLAPAQRVMFLLNEDEGVDDTTVGLSRHMSHPLFTELEELTGVGDAQEWRETARWVKFEEDVEEGGNRWSKPHVATLSLHSLFELRSCLRAGTVILEMEADTLEKIVDITLDKMVASHQLEFQYRDDIREALLRRHKHQYQSGGKSGLSSQAGASQHQSFIGTVRSIADIGRSFSHGKNLQSQQSHDDAKKSHHDDHQSDPQHTPMLELPKVGSVPREMGRESSQVDAIIKGNLHFLKKLPRGTEASNVLIGEVDFLRHHITAFVRLKNAVLLGDLTEVPVPTRFLFVLLGPFGHASQYREIGRAMATLMSDEVFHDVAYKARSGDDLLDGVDEFLDQVTVLPPGEWDPNIRIEPPSHVPSQEKRKHTATEGQKSTEGNGHGGGAGGAADDEGEEEGGHGSDPSLKRTGKLFGGLLGDIRRKLPWMLSDYTDALNLQSLATFCFMYFALLAPIVTFGGLLEEATHSRMAAMENLLSGAICGVAYHLLAGQPLTVIGSTGPVLVFEKIMWNLCSKDNLNVDFLAFRFWINLWVMLILLVVVATDGSSLVSYITRFTEESFATLIAVIFIYEAVVKLFKIMGTEYSDVIVYNPGVTNATCSCEGKSPSDLHFLEKLANTHHLDLAAVPWLIRDSTTSFAADVLKNVTRPLHDADHLDLSSKAIDYSHVPLKMCAALKGELVGNGCFHMYDVFLMSAVLMAGTFILSSGLKQFKNSCYFPSRVRSVVSDFAVMLAIVIMTLFDRYIGVDTQKLNVPVEFKPTWSGRGWIVSPLNISILAIFIAIFPAIIATILIFMDQQITAVIVNRKENKLKKGCGYHLDLFVLAILVGITGILGIPIYVAATVLSINHVNALKVESESRAPGEVATFVGVREQRFTGVITFVFIGGSVLLTNVLRLIPMPVLYGVFLYMGISALGGIQLWDRILLFLMPMKYQPDYIYLRHVPIRKVHLFTLCQVVCFAVLWVVKSIKMISIAFPIMLVVMVAARKVMERFFSDETLKHLDDKMPEIHLRTKEDAKKKKEAAAEKARRDSGGGGSGGDESALRAVKTEAHLHIPMASGNVMKIPLSSISEHPEERPINLSDEVNKSGIWQHIQSETSLAQQSRDTDRTAPIAEPDDEPITIKVQAPDCSSQNLKKF